MITKIKNFSVFKAKESDNEKLPSHRLSAKVGEVFVDIGACWKKEGKSGTFLSAKLADAWVDHTDNSKSRKAIALFFEDDIKKLCESAGVEYEDSANNAPTSPKTNDTAF